MKVKLQRYFYPLIKQKIMVDEFQLELLTIGWLPDLPEDGDLCAHGHVLVRIGNSILSDATLDEWTVSAGALYLLRTLTQNHLPEAPICDQLLPCCGFTMWPHPTSDDVLIFGCTNGIDWNVQHEPDAVRLTAADGATVLLSDKQYQAKVLAFVDAVEHFYQRSQPKNIPADPHDAEGYALFWREWHRRRVAFA
ncbi:hypothetical protein [Hymenobacter sp. HDW8]|uniref:hypothetical protein n=1 Tax=Hymenobacter sp. HDW8 TaxID=2714932 RepID=UPI00140E4561|nr:hypothetical protein [Hymenobacter sp. HDW8]QIL74805.1 hypothetical protein G7064_02210 [Hymenobacter sp. HDW8]